MPVAGQRARHGFLSDAIRDAMKTIQLKPDLARTRRLEPNHEPLYKRLPTHDEDGKFLSDFMMLIPGLKNLSQSNLNARMSALHSLLGGHDDVVFADLNTPLNLLWVSVRARHGVIRELAAEIQLRVPEARLVGHPMKERRSRFDRVRAFCRLKLKAGRGVLAKAKESGGY
jgi:hypothetical protein